MLTGNLPLCQTKQEDLTAVAKCHAACFPDSLAASLGLAYVKKTLEWFLVSDNHFLFHIQDGEKVVGYCGGFIPKGNGDGSSSGMLQHAFAEAVKGVLRKPWLAFHEEVRPMYPFIFKNIKRKLFPSTHKVTQQPANTIKYAGLVVIGVHPDYRGTGIFPTLMEEFFAQSKKYPVQGGRLSVRRNNERGINAYKKFGWEIEQENEKMYTLVKKFE